jgi:RNA polymerase sigma factor (sigma-70 family)
MPTQRLAPVLRYLRTVGPDGATFPDGQLLKRFIDNGDEEAFAELVRRHGPMVLGTCRRLLRDCHDADDAFQATFLLLARKAGSLRQPDLLGAWLHGVACRTASKARTLANRRRQRQRPLADRGVPPCDDLLWRDLRPVLDDAIGALPAKYRVPFVLCYLEGLTNAEAAARLGCPPGTVATRLARARQRLRVRLAARGLGPASVLLAAIEGSEAARAAVPAALAGAAVRAAMGTAPGVSAGAAVLMNGVWRTMLMERVRVFVVALAAVGTMVGGAGWLTYRARAVEPPIVAEEPRIEPPRPAPAPAVAPITPPTVPAPVEGREERTERATFRTDNFTVTAPSHRIARLVGAAAEHHRKEQALRWLGKEMPTWKKPCPIRVTITTSGTGGATTFAFDNGRVLEQNMHLEGALDRILADGLPHEVTHTVFAHYFRCPVPRWADEGGAVLSEDEEEIQRYQKTTREILAHGRAIPLRRLLVLKDFPKDVMALYAQGTTLTQFLVKRKDRKTFLQFVADGKDGHWDTALAKHYGFKSVEHLEEAWLRVYRKSDKAPVPPAVAEPERHLPEGPAPISTVARLNEQGDLTVFLPGENYYQPVTTYISRDGKDPVPVTSYRLQVQERLRQFGLDQVKGFRPDGTVIASSDLAKRLGKKSVPVLVSADGKPVDPRHLRVVKEDTIILIVPQVKPAEGTLVVPQPQPAPAPAVPPPAPVPADPS